MPAVGKRINPMASPHINPSSPPSKTDRPKVVIKKTKAHHGGHHGGAWKVAYADFVTAMMALFIVLWVLGAADKKYKSGIAHYFREPGVFTGTRGIIPDGGHDKLGAGIVSAPSLEVLQAHIEQKLAGSNEIQDIADQVPITLTKDGLKIEVLDKDSQAFFDLSSAVVKPLMRRILAIIASEVRQIPNELVIAGHTDGRRFHNDKYYSNWDLSTQRALNTRRVLEEFGISSERVQQVSGFADRQLRTPGDPLNSENRRISILIRSDVPPISSPSS
jgi:chemotaxis protein MotB